MKITIIFANFPYYSIELANSLSKKKGVNVQLIAFRKKNEFVSSEDTSVYDQNLRSIVDKSIDLTIYQHYKLKDPRWLINHFRMVSKIRNSNPEVIIFQMLGYRNYPLTFLPKKSKKIY